MTIMMKTAIQYAINDIRLEEHPIPKINPGEILLKTRACGLSGGETMAWYKTDPKVLGHKSVGEVVELGVGVTDYKISDHLFVDHHVGRINGHLSWRGHFIREPFQNSTHLDPGGMCEYVRITAQHLAMDIHPIPETISDEEAVTIEPGSRVLYDLKLCLIQPGDNHPSRWCRLHGTRIHSPRPLFDAHWITSTGASTRPVISSPRTRSIPKPTIHNTPCAPSSTAA